MRTHLLLRRRAATLGTAVSDGAVVTPVVPEGVSGVSVHANVRFALSSLSVGLGLCVASCAEPSLDGLPEDPGQHKPIPTIGPPAESQIPFDAGATVTSDDGDDARDASLGESDASVDGTQPNAGYQDAGRNDTDTTDPTVTAPTSTAVSSTTGTLTTGPQSSSATSSTTGGQSTSAANTNTSETSDHSDTSDGSDATEPTDDLADAGGWYPEQDAGVGEPEADAGDAGDAGFDGGGAP